ncbi:calcium-binding protein [Aestuariivirga sp.]|uniref:calcium-binding protein n=1 Tax=Aestuariivirga sp. TaxID=2650926 RepID=UPI003592FBA9
MPVWVLTEGADNFPASGPPPPDDWKNTGSDQIFGLGGDDLIFAGLLADTVNAGDGNDEVSGGDDLDILLGGNGNDKLNGDDGDDSLTGEAGVDLLHGNAGDDSISGGLGGDKIFGDDGNDIINGDDGDDTINGGSGSDTIYTGAGSDIARAGSGNDTFGSVVDTALAGDTDLLFGDGGNDLLLAYGRPVDGWTATFDGGTGTDTVRAGGDIRHYSFADVEVLQATNLIVATAEQFNQFSLFTDINGFSDVTSFNISTAGVVDFSGRIDDSITSLAVTGSIDGNTIIGGAGDDLLRGFVFPIGEVPGPASVHLEGRGGNDYLQGSNGDDYLDGGTGEDVMYGAGGHNVYIVDNAFDIVSAGGDGIDEVRTSLNSYDSSALFGGNLIDKIVFTGTGDFTGVLRASGGTIIGGDGNDTLTGASGGVFDGNQTFIGGGGNDIITGANDLPDTASYSTATARVVVSLLIAGAQNTGSSTGSDTLSGIENLTGSTFADKLRGDGASNQLDGGRGNDVIIGGIGPDVLRGGNGSDVFDYNDITESTVTAVGRDTIVDFNERATDQINLSTIDANSVLAGNNAFIFVGAAAFTGLGQIRAFAAGSNTIVDINTTGSNAADMRIVLTGSHVLDVTDFVL